MSAINKKITRTTAGLNEVLMDELDALINGDSTPQMASAKSRVVNSVLAVTRMEMDAERFVAQVRAEGGGLKALSLSK